MSPGIKTYIIIIVSILFIFPFRYAYPQEEKNDSLTLRNNQNNKYDNFYDSLKYKADQKKITRLLHNALFPANGTEDAPADSSVDNTGFAGKTIGKINIIRLAVFGPSVRDTSRKAKLWYEKTGNFIHTRSDLHNIRKNLLFKKGDTLEIAEIYENERLLRALPYIRDARILIEPDSLDAGKINMTLLTQDRFSIGVTGDVTGWKSAALEIYNNNIFGVGHEISVRFVGHLTREPFMGLETFYKISNISGRFISFTTGYMNTYLNEGAMLLADKAFLRVSDKWGYGIAGYYFDRAGELPGELHLRNALTFGYYQASGWGGRNFQLGKTSSSQLTFTGQVIHRQFSDRPAPLPNGEQYYQNTSLFLAGMTWSKRTYQTDALIYGYGITEDIPKGFKHEWVVGFDNNEFGNRLYTHLNLSNANIFPRQPDYFYLAACLGGFVKSGRIEQGMVEFNSNYISRLFSSGNARFREFVSINYRLGVNRFQLENLHFEKNNLIRGFDSSEINGKQRLSLNAESVYFQKRNFYRFNMAFFIFADLGIMASDREWFFRGNFYSGLGAGLRLHNESLVLKTLQIRLTFYPNHPKDVGLVGFLLNEHTRQTFYSFQPEPPTPRRFE